MKRTAVILFVLAGLAAALADTGRADPRSTYVAPWRIKEIHAVREKVSHCRSDVFRGQYLVSRAKPVGEAYRKWVLNRWRDRLHDCKVEREKILYSVARRIDRGLGRMGSPMTGNGLAFASAGLRYHVNPYFVAAISITESTAGLAACGYNAWGLGACGRAWSPPHFDSWSEGITYATWYIHDHWPSARSPYDVGRGYAGGSTTWAPKTASHMANFFGADSGVAYYPWNDA